MNSHLPTPKLSSQSDQDLMNAFVYQEDQYALWTLLNRYRPMLRKALRKFSYRLSLDEFTQEFYLILFQKLRQAPHITCFAPWLKRVVHNYLIDESRRDSVINKYQNYCAEQPITYYPDVDTKLDQQSLAKAALDQVNHIESECLHLRFYDDLDYKGIAETLGLSLKQVCGRLNRGMGKMRGYFHVDQVKSQHTHMR